MLYDILEVDSNESLSGSLMIVRACEFTVIPVPKEFILDIN